MTTDRLVTPERFTDALAYSRAPQKVRAELDVTLPVLRRRIRDLTHRLRWRGVEDGIAAVERAA